MKNKVCTFYGNSVNEKEIKKLEEIFMDLIENKGVTMFFSNGRGFFAAVCEEIIHGIKEKNKRVKLCLAVPYMHGEITSRAAYYVENYDDVVVPAFGDIYFSKAFYDCDKWIADHSDVCVCHSVMKSDDINKICNYARKRQKEIIDV